MLAGQPPFVRDTRAHTLAAILHDSPPDLAAERPDLPPTACRLVLRCLEKSPTDRYGSTDELGFKAVEGRVHLHDLHATVLHLMGLDHKQLTYRYAGRDFRITDVHGHVVEEIVA